MHITRTAMCRMHGSPLARRLPKAKHGKRGTWHAVHAKYEPCQHSEESSKRMEKRDFLGTNLYITWGCCAKQKQKQHVCTTDSGSRTLAFRLGRNPCVSVYRLLSINVVIPSITSIHVAIHRLRK